MKASVSYVFAAETLLGLTTHFTIRLSKTQNMNILHDIIHYKLIVFPTQQRKHYFNSANLCIEETLDGALLVVPFRFSQVIVVAGPVVPAAAARSVATRIISICFVQREEARCTYV